MSDHKHEELEHSQETVSQEEMNLDEMTYTEEDAFNISIDDFGTAPRFDQPRETEPEVEELQPSLWERIKNSGAVTAVLGFFAGIPEFVQGLVKKEVPIDELGLDPVARRKEMVRRRRKKRQQVKVMILSGMAVIGILVVVLLAMFVKMLVTGNGDSGKDKTPVTTEAPAPTPTPIPLPVQVDLQNQQIADTSSLSREILNWGYGPARDDSNRPNDAVLYQEKYGQYNAHFVENTDEKVIYLTLDEGYEYGYTPAILDALKEMDCPAVFFVTMDYVKKQPELVQRMIDEGHVVGNHSVNHPADGVPSLDVAGQESEITELHDYVLENFDYKMWLWRYPAGKFSEQSLAILNNHNYQALFWSYAYYDFDTENQMPVNEALNKALNSLHPGAIYLLHAVSETNTNMMKDFIQGARDQGYTFKLYTGDPNLYLTSSHALSAGGTGAVVTESPEMSGSEDSTAKVIVNKVQE